ncbi:MAG: hypothetical protein WCE91_02610 [Nitrososphaeraceae archaeon]
MEPGDSIFACAGILEHERGTMIFLTVRNTEDLLDAGIVGHTPSKSRACQSKPNKLPRVSEYL